MNQEELSGLSSRLNLPVSALQKLPFHQISSIQKLINHKNYFFKNQNDENIIDYERLTHIMQVEGIPVVGTISMKELIQLLRKNNISLSPSDSSLLCQALSRNSETQLVSIQLFLSFVKYFNKLHSSPGSISSNIVIDTAVFNVTTALQLLELELPNLLFIFELLATSSVAHHSVDGVVIISRDQFIDQLRLINITLTQENTSKLFSFFNKIGVCCVNNDDVHVDYIVQVGLLSLKRRGIVPSSDSNIVFHMNKWTKELMVKWGQIRDYLELNQFQMSINEQIFQTCLKVVGVLISPVDVHQVWIHALTKLNYINRVNSNSISSIGITLEELRRALCNDTSVLTSGSIGSLSKDVPPNRVRQSVATAGTKSQSNSLTGSIVVDSDDRSVQSGYPRPPATSYPWVASETDLSSNLRNRIRVRIAGLNSSSFRDFSRVLQQTPPHNMLTRSIIHEALFLVGIKISNVEAQNIWSQFLVFCHHEAPSAKLLESYLQIELEKIVIAPAPVQEVKSVFTPPPPPVQSEPAPSYAPVVEETPAAPVVAPSDSQHVIVDETQKLMNAVSILQGMRASIALIFRRLNGITGSNTVNAIKCRDLVYALLQPPIELQLSIDEVWRLVCDMAALDYNSNPATAYILYQDVASYLDRASEGTGSYKTLQVIASIKRKLYNSSSIGGDKVKLYALTSNLRNHMRYAIAKGKSNISWDGVPDYCSASTLMSLFTSIDVHLTATEAKFVCKQSDSMNEFQVSAIDDVGTRLGAAIMYLGELLG